MIFVWVYTKQHLENRVCRPERLLDIALIHPSILIMLAVNCATLSEADETVLFVLQVFYSNLKYLTKQTLWPDGKDRLKRGSPKLL